MRKTTCAATRPRGRKKTLADPPRRLLAPNAPTVQTVTTVRLMVPAAIAEMQSRRRPKIDLLATAHRVAGVPTPADARKDPVAANRAPKDRARPRAGVESKGIQATARRPTEGRAMESRAKAAGTTNAGRAKECRTAAKSPVRR